MIRVPLLGIHAPWDVLLAAAVLMVLMLAAAGAALVLWPLPLELTAAWSRLRRSLAAAVTVAGALALTARQTMRPPPWLRRHRSRAERDSRKHLRIPLAYPENVAGSDEAAERGDFPIWLAELEEAGIDAGEIVREESQ